MAHTNPAFQKALQEHMDIWASDPRSFASNSSPGDLLREIEEHEKANEQTLVRRYASRLSKLIRNFQGFFSAVDAFVSSNPQTAGLVWGGLRFIIQTVSNFSAYFEQVVGVLETISQNLYFYHSYATELYRNSDRVMKALADVYGDILTVLMAVKRTFIDSKNRKRHPISVIARTINPFRAPFASVVTNLNERRALLEAETQHADREVESRDRQRGKIDKLLEILKYEAIDCEEKHKSTRKHILSQGSPGSWLIHRDDYKAWRDSSTGSTGLFWLHGQPGAGKTVLASIVIEDIKLHLLTNAIVAYFYCDYKSTDKSSPANILRSLLCQLLCAFQPPVPPSVTKMLDKYSSVRSVHALPLADMISQIVEEYTSVSFVIDAMDECQDRTEILPQLRQLSGTIRLFISSRDGGDIETNFRQYLRYEVTMMRTGIQADIKYFVAETHIHANPLFIRNASLIDEIIRTIVEKANGMFLLAYFQLKEILERDSDSSIREALGNLPRGLEEFYVRALVQIDSHPSQKRLMRLLRWLVCTRDPPFDPLFDAIAIDDMGDIWDTEKMINDKKRLIEACGHLVSVTEEVYPRVIFTHFSVYQFLTSNPADWRQTLPLYHSYPISDTYTTIAISCAKFFSISNFPNPWQLIRSVLATWTDHGDVLDRSSLLCTMFKAPLAPSLRPGNPFPVFPLAENVVAIDCKFMHYRHDAYNVFMHKCADPWFGGLSFEDVFPNVTNFMGQSLFLCESDSQLNVFLDPASFTFSGSGSPSQATDVVVKGYTFITGGRDSWNIFPTVGAIRNDMAVRPDAGLNPKRVVLEGGSITDISGFGITFIVENPTYDFHYS